MAKNQDFDDKLDIRKSLVTAIYSHVNKERIASSETIKSRNERIDVICNILRDAVKSAPIVMFSGIPHVYTSKVGCYQPFQWIDMNDAIYDVMRKSGVRDGDYGKIDLITKRCMTAVMDRNYALDPSVIVMKNGTYDTMDHQLHQHSEKYMTNMYVDYEYNVNDYPMNWKKFLSEVLPDQEMQDLLQEVVAATFVDRKLIKLESCTILLGQGSNGKSVVFEVITSMLGKANVSNFSIADLISATRKDQCIASCNGKRLNYCSEIRTKEISKSNSDAFKNIVSGEPVMARSLYHDYFSANNIPMIMANANSLPILSDPSYAMERRFIIIPFDTKIEEADQNKELPYLLCKELPGVFNWAMEGLMRLASKKFQISIPEKSRILVRDYVRESNQVMRFVEERRYFSKYNKNTRGYSEFISMKNLYNDFLMWCSDNKEVVIQKREFSDRMSEMLFEKVRRSNGWGFVVNIAKTNDEIRSENLDLALARQKLSGALSVGTINDAGKIKVRGILDLERYLGLPENSLWPYLQNGRLEGAYSREGDTLVFDVVEAQNALSSANYYKKLDTNQSDLMQNATHAVRAIRSSFNIMMRNKGLPIRKVSPTSKNISKDNQFCIIVPDEWEYTEAAARKLFRDRENEEKIQLWNKNNPNKQIII